MSGWAGWFGWLGLVGLVGGLGWLGRWVWLGWVGLVGLVWLLGRLLACLLVCLLAWISVAIVVVVGRGGGGGVEKWKGEWREVGNGLVAVFHFLFVYFFVCIIVPSLFVCSFTLLGTVLALLAGLWLDPYG